MIDFFVVLFFVSFGYMDVNFCALSTEFAFFDGTYSVYVVVCLSRLGVGRPV